MSDLSEVKNFGPYMVKIMHEIGVFSREDLMHTDYKKIKADLIKKGIQPHMNIFYSIEMGLQNRIWSDISQQEMQEMQVILK